MRLIEEEYNNGVYWYKIDISYGDDGGFIHIKKSNSCTLSTEELLNRKYNAYDFYLIYVNSYYSWDEVFNKEKTVINEFWRLEKIKKISAYKKYYNSIINAFTNG